MKQHKIILIGLLSYYTFTGVAHAQNPSSVVTEKKESHQTSIGLSPYAYQTSVDELKFSGPGISLNIDHSITKKVSLVAYFQESVSRKSNYSSIYTGFKFGAKYSLWGFHERYDKNLKYNNQNIIKQNSFAPRGLQAGLHIAQFSINAGSSIISFVGFGTSLSYHFSLGTRIGGNVEVHYDKLSNQPTTVTNIQTMLGISYWLM